MSNLDQLWAGWRSEYVAGTSAPKVDAPNGCVFCGLVQSGLPDDQTNIVWKGELVFAILNAFPYGTGHLLIMPIRHVGDLGGLTEGESVELWSATQAAVAAIDAAYSSDGANIGANLGAAAGAGIPEHLHMHALPRWTADTNFMTAVANTRVLPEALATTWSKLREAWPAKN